LHDIPHLGDKLALFSFQNQIVYNMQDGTQ